MWNVLKMAQKMIEVDLSEMLQKSASRTGNPPISLKKTFFKALIKGFFL